MARIYSKTQALDYLQTCQFRDSNEPNIFNHPAFLLPALRNLGSDQCQLLVLDQPCEHLLLPFQVRRAGLGFKKTIISWGNLYTTQSTPLIKTDNMQATLTALLEELGQSTHALPDTWLLPDLDLSGSVAQMLIAIAKEKNLPLAITRQQQRPVLASNDEPEQYLTKAIGKNHYRDYRRLWRRLSETGELHYEIATDTADITAAFEDFLKLEAAGWKGKGSTALLSQPRDAEFAREAITALAQQNLVRLHMLTLDGKMIAGLVVFYNSHQAWTWKTAFDENLRSFSPGVLLMIELLKTHLKDPALRLTDSCAIPDHPVMSRLFQERRPFASLILGLNDQSHSSVKTIERQLTRYDLLRETIGSFKSRWHDFKGK